MGCGRSRVAPNAAYAASGVPNELRRRRQTISDPVHRAVTLKHLQRLSQFVKQTFADGDVFDTDPKSSTHGQRLYWDTVTIAQVHTHFVVPLTSKYTCSFMEIISKRVEQAPEWCVTHAWDERFRDVISLLGHHAKCHNDTNPAYWIAAFALNGSEAIETNIAILSACSVDKLPFARALRHSDCAGMLTLVGEKGVALKRSWVVLEEFTRQSVGKKRDIGIMARDDRAQVVGGGPVVLLDEGGAGNSGPWKEVGKVENLHFPWDVARACVDFRVADCSAGDEQCKEAILRVLSQSNADEEPPEHSAAYEDIEHAIRTPFYSRAICQAVVAGDSDSLLKLLVSALPALNEVLPQKGAAVHVAAERNAKACMKVLLDAMANPAVVRLEDGASPAYLAGASHAATCLRMLLDEHADPNQARKLDRASPMHAAAEATACIQHLLAARGDPNWPNKDGATPLHLAAEGNALDSVHTLLHGKADPNRAMIRKHVGATPVHMATIKGNNVCLHVLLGANGDPNQALPDSRTPVIISAENDNKACLKILLDARADPDCLRGFDGFRAVHIATAKASLSCLKLLLDADCNTNVPVDGGMTALCIAARDGHLACLRLLIAAKGDLNWTSQEGWAPLDYATKHGNRDLASAIRESGGQSHRPPSPTGCKVVAMHSRPAANAVTNGAGREKGVNITIINAKGVRFSDIGGKSDPYVVCEVCCRKGFHWKFQTKVAKCTLAPEWNHEETISGFYEGDSLKFELWDKDMFPKPDDFLGAARIRSDEIFPGGWEGELRLCRTRNLKGKSETTLKVRVVPFNPEKS